jgi:hypothetical protein
VTPLLPGVPPKPRFVVRSFEAVDSADVPLCQLADFFAGVATFTRTRAAAVRSWMADESGQSSLFEEVDMQLSNRDRERLPVVKHLYDHCTRTRQGVSLLTNGYLHSPRGGAAVNFWHYEPQRADDRAPRKLRL